MNRILYVSAYALIYWLPRLQLIFVRHQLWNNFLINGLPRQNDVYTMTKFVYMWDYINNKNQKFIGGLFNNTTVFKFLK